MGGAPPPVGGALAVPPPLAEPEVVSAREAPPDAEGAPDALPQPLTEALPEADSLPPHPLLPLGEAVAEPRAELEPEEDRPGDPVAGAVAAVEGEPPARELLGKKVAAGDADARFPDAEGGADASVLPDLAAVEEAPPEGASPTVAAGEGVAATLGRAVAEPTPALALEVGQALIDAVPPPLPSEEPDVVALPTPPPLTLGEGLAGADPLPPPLPVAGAEAEALPVGERVAPPPLLLAQGSAVGVAVAGAGALGRGVKEAPVVALSAAEAAAALDPPPLHDGDPEGGAVPVPEKEASGLGEAGREGGAERVPSAAEGVGAAVPLSAATAGEGVECGAVLEGLGVGAPPEGEGLPVLLALRPLSEGGGVGVAPPAAGDSVGAWEGAALPVTDAVAVGETEGAGLREWDGLAASEAVLCPNDAVARGEGAASAECCAGAEPVARGEPLAPVETEAAPKRDGDGLRLSAARAELLALSVAASEARASAVALAQPLAPRDWVGAPLPAPDPVAEGEAVLVPLLGPPVLWGAEVGVASAVGSEEPLPGATETVAPTLPEVPEVVGVARDEPSAGAVGAGELEPDAGPEDGEAPLLADKGRDSECTEEGVGRGGAERRGVALGELEGGGEGRPLLEAVGVGAAVVDSCGDALPAGVGEARPGSEGEGVPVGRGVVDALGGMLPVASSEGVASAVGVGAPDAVGAPPEPEPAGVAERLPSRGDGEAAGDGEEAAESAAARVCAGVGEAAGLPVAVPQPVPPGPVALAQGLLARDPAADADRGGVGVACAVGAAAAEAVLVGVPPPAPLLGVATPVAAAVAEALGHARAVLLPARARVCVPHTEPAALPEALLVPRPALAEAAPVAPPEGLALALPVPLSLRCGEDEACREAVGASVGASLGEGRAVVVAAGDGGAAAEGREEGEADLERPEAEASDEKEGTEGEALAAPLLLRRAEAVPPKGAAAVALEAAVGLLTAEGATAAERDALAVGGREREAEGDVVAAPLPLPTLLMKPLALALPLTRLLGDAAPRVAEGGSVGRTVGLVDTVCAGDRSPLEVPEGTLGAAVPDALPPVAVAMGGEAVGPRVAVPQAPLPVAVPGAEKTALRDEVTEPLPLPPQPLLLATAEASGLRVAPAAVPLGVAVPPPALTDALREGAGERVAEPEALGDASAEGVDVCCAVPRAVWEGGAEAGALAVVEGLPVTEAAAVELPPAPLPVLLPHPVVVGTAEPEARTVAGALAWEEREAEGEGEGGLDGRGLRESESLARLDGDGRALLVAAAEALGEVLARGDREAGAEAAGEGLGGALALAREEWDRELSGVAVSVAGAVAAALEEGLGDGPPDAVAAVALGDGVGEAPRLPRAETLLLGVGAALPLAPPPLPVMLALRQPEVEAEGMTPERDLGAEKLGEGPLSVGRADGVAQKEGAPDCEGGELAQAEPLGLPGSVGAAENDTKVGPAEPLPLMVAEAPLPLAEGAPLPVGAAAEAVAAPGVAVAAEGLGVAGALPEPSLDPLGEDEARPVAVPQRDSVPPPSLPQGEPDRLPQGEAEWVAKELAVGGLDAEPDGLGRGESEA